MALVLPSWFGCSFCRKRIDRLEAAPGRAKPAPAAPAAPAGPGWEISRGTGHHDPVHLFAGHAQEVGLCDVAGEGDKDGRAGLHGRQWGGATSSSAGRGPAGAYPASPPVLTMWLSL